MKLIPLTRGMIAKVDDEDYPLLSRHRWCAKPNSVQEDKFYAVTAFALPDGTQRLMYMQHLILGVWRQVDHINGDTMDYQKSNLRPCTQQQNNWNACKRKSTLGKPTTSKYKGVMRNGKKFLAMITKDRVRYRIGRFETEEEAARAYDAKAREFFGDFAWLNFPATN